MKIAIVGFGVEGQAAYDYWRDGNDITICDQQPTLALPDSVHGKLGDDYLQGLGEFDVIVRSPFVRPDAITAANGPAVLTKVTSSTNEFLRVCPTQNIIGVTGTKGKGTTSSLIAALLRAAGKKVHLGGNIGVAALELLKSNIQPDDWIVLELSSFQLIDLKASPTLAVCLMVVPEHLDWHINLDEYFTAKQQLFRWQTEKDTAVYFADNEQSAQISSASNGQRIPYFAPPGAFVDGDQIVIDGQVLCQTSELQLLGKHNWQNVCAAVTTVWQISPDPASIRQTLQCFVGLEHRLELVREFNDVKYYDDSFGTTPETAIVAIEAFEQPKVVILGGSDKGAPYDALAATVAKSAIRKVLLIGEQANRIQQALDAQGFTNYQPGGLTMTEIVTNAQNLSQPGDVVLLSTGCASFGMFKNYKDRGNQFKTAVQALGSTAQ